MYTYCRNNMRILYVCIVCAHHHSVFVWARTVFFMYTCCLINPISLSEFLSAVDCLASFCFALTFENAALICGSAAHGADAPQKDDRLDCCVLFLCRLL